jgi:hypothetical protein
MEYRLTMNKYTAEYRIERRPNARCSWVAYKHYGYDEGEARADLAILRGETDEQIWQEVV